MAGSRWVLRSCCGRIRRGGQQWFSLSDPGMEEAFYESAVLRRFAGVDLGVAAAPDETTILRFRHLLEQHHLCGEMLMTVNRYLETKGIHERSTVRAWGRFNSRALLHFQSDLYDGGDRRAKCPRQSLPQCIHANCPYSGEYIHNGNDAPIAWRN